MFTGIIESTATVLDLPSSGLVLERPAIFEDLTIGQSIAVSGVCLSVIAFDQTSMTFDVVETTKQKTKLGLLQKGDTVNLERAMKANGRFEGHIVLGHVEATGTVITISEASGTVEINFPPELARYIVSEGSITIDGVALTVASLHENHLSVALIPHTRTTTTLGNLQKGDRVHLETDILAKYILQKNHANT